MSLELNKSKLNNIWNTLKNETDALDYTKAGVGLILPGCCLAILPATVNLDAPDRDSKLWYGVYIKSRWSDTAYALVAWCYTKEDALEVLTKDEHKKIRKQISKLPKDELILSTHADAIEVVSIEGLAQIHFGPGPKPETADRLVTKFLIFGDKPKLVTATPEVMSEHLGVTVEST